MLCRVPRRALPLPVLILCAARVGAAAPAPAPGTPLVAVLGTAEDASRTGRLAAELRAMRMQVDLRIVASDDAGGPEAAAALREGASAAVRVASRAGRIEVSIADPTTRNVGLHQVLEGQPTATLDAVLALQTV